MNLLLGVDGGGTKLNLLLTDLEGNLVKSITKNVSTIDSVSLKETYELICEGLNDMLLDVKTFQIVSGFIGLSGISNEEDEKILIGMLKKNICLRNTVLSAKSDVFNAYKGSLKNDYGISLIIGTGIVAYAIEEDTKKEVQVGGYSFKEGDFGSSYDMGKKALSLLSKSIDHRIESSSLILELQEKFNVKKFSDVKKLVENLYENRTEVAQLSKLVTKHADLKDENAILIIKLCVDEAALHIKAILKQIKLRNYEVAITGGLGNANTLYRKLLYQKIMDIDSRFYVHPNELHPCCGSIVIAMEQVKINDRQYRDNLKKIIF